MATADPALLAMCASEGIATVVVVDLGDRVMVRPLPAEPVAALRGKYRGRGPGTDRARREARADEVPARRRP